MAQNTGKATTLRRADHKAAAFSASSRDHHQRQPVGQLYCPCAVRATDQRDKVDVLFAPLQRITFPTTDRRAEPDVLPIPSGVALQIYGGATVHLQLPANAAEYVGKSYLGLLNGAVDPARCRAAAVVYADIFTPMPWSPPERAKREIAGTDKGSTWRRCVAEAALRWCWSSAMA